MSQSYEMRMKKGEFVTCHAPFGYRLDRCSLIIDDNKADIVRFIFNSYINGMSTRDIADSLNTQQISNLGAYDDMLVKQTVESMKVLSRDKLLIRFKSGIEMTMNLQG